MKLSFKEAEEVSKEEEDREELEASKLAREEELELEDVISLGTSDSSEESDSEKDRYESDFIEDDSGFSNFTNFLKVLSVAPEDFDFMPELEAFSQEVEDLEEFESSCEEIKKSRVPEEIDTSSDSSSDEEIILTRNGKRIN